MKHLLQTVFCSIFVFLSLSLNAQSIIFSESFDNDTIPANWTTSTIYGGIWEIGNDSINSPGYYSTAPEHTGNNGFYAYMNAIGLDSGAMLNSPPLIDISQYNVVLLEFYMYSNSSNNYSINQLFVDAYNGSSWIKVDSILQFDTVWVKHTFNLSPYIYNNSYVQFRFRVESLPSSSSSHYNDILIDDVKLVEPIPNDLQMVEIMGVDSFMHINPVIPIGVKIKNLGSQPQDSFKLDFSVDSGQSYITEWCVDTIDPYETLIHSFTPTANLGQVNVWNLSAVVSNNGDTIQGNDTTKFTIETGVPLNGTYTLGHNVAADFSSFQHLTTHLRKFGVSGPVLINVQPGSYCERIVFPDIIGMSSSTPLHIKGLGDQTILNDSCTDVFFLPFIDIKNQQFITIDSFLIDDSYRTNSRPCINIYQSRHIHIKNCEIELEKYYAVGLQLRQSTQIRITDNSIRGGARAIDFYYYYSFPGYSDSIYILRNKFVNQYKYGIYSIYANNLQIEFNEIIINKTTIQSEFASAIKIVTSKGNNRIHNNRIQYDLGLEGISVHHNHQYNGTYTITNNIINIALNNPTVEANGLFVQSATKLNCWNNSVKLSGSSSDLNYATRILHIDTLSFLNNNSTNYVSGYAIGGIFISNVKTINYNNYYTTGAYIASLGNVNISAFSQWQNTLSQDLQSFNYDPLFQVDSLLIPTSLPLHHKGSFIPDVPLDYAGNQRSINNTDIGAMQFNTIPIDLSALEFTNPDKELPDSLKTIGIKIHNNGSDPIHHFNVHYSIDNGNSYVTEQCTDTIASNDTLNYYFQNRAFMYTMKLYQLRAYISHAMDTISINDSTKLNMQVGSNLNGTYSLGSLQSDNFNDFASLTMTMDTFSLTGPVIIDVLPGTYDEQISLNDISSINSTNTLQILGKGDQTILTNSAGNANDPEVLILQKVKHVKIENFHILRHVNASHFTGILAFSNCHNITLSKCYINANNSTEISTGIALAGYTPNTKFVIKNNTLEDLHYGINLSGPQGSVCNHVIKNNRLLQVSNSIYCGNISKVSITNNYIESAATPLNYAITSSGSENGLLIAKNEIHLSNSYKAIDISNYNLSNANSDPAIIKNNVVTNFTQHSYKYGLICSNSKNVRIVNNSVAVYSMQPYTKTFMISGSATSDVKIINNIFRHNIDYIFYSPAGLSNSYENNYNNLYSDGTLFCYHGSDVANLSDWQTITNDGANSVSINPGYYDINKLLTGSPSMNNLGKPLSYVTDDFFGNPRDPQTPDIGAYEFDPLMFDLGPDTTINYTNGMISYDIDFYPNASIVWHNGSTSTYQTFDSSNLVIGSNVVYATITEGAFSYSDTVVITVDYDVAIKEHRSNDLFIQIYPNPTEGQVTLSYEKLKENIKIELINSQGSVVYDSELKAHSQRYQLNLDYLPKGFYILRLEGKSIATNKKIIIQ